MGRLPSDTASGGEFVPRPLAVDLKPGDQVGEYLVSQKIGEGGMATVYGAIHPIIGKRAAIKVLAPWLSSDTDQVERFVQEARAVNAIGHVNIVDVFAFGQLPDGRCYFIMEWLQGRTLYDVMYERRPSLDVTLDVIDQMCEALEAAHEKGIVHRDLKPANVFLVPARDGRLAVKLLDFGVAKLTHPIDGQTAAQGPHTESGKVVGTPDYISPEQARGQPVDGRTDLYALGIMAYELILGRRPFEAANFMDVLRMHLDAPPPPPRKKWPEIPSVLERLMLGLLEKKPDKRPSILEVREAIRELRGTPVPVAFAETGPMSVMGPSTITPVVPPLRAPGGAAGRRRMVIAGLLVVGAVTAVLAWRGRQRGSQVASLAPASAASPVATPTQAPIAAPIFAPPLPALDPPTVEEITGATLVITVDAPDAHILVDGKPAGARVVLERAGDHLLEVSAPGRKPYSARVDAGDGVVTTVAVRLERERERGHRRAPAAGAEDPDYLVNPFGGHK